MDMKKILQALDDAPKKAAVNSSDMKKFLTIVEGKGPLNRSTQAEAMIMQENEPVKKSITSPVLNVAKDAKPSMIGKYFKTVEQEIAEASERTKDRAKDLAERVAGKVNKDNGISKNKETQFHAKLDKLVHNTFGKRKGEMQEQYSYKDIAEMARQGLSNEEIAEELGFDLTEGLKDPKDNPCWKGYKPVGTKKKGGRTVPNCVPTKEASIPFAGKKVGHKEGPAGQLKGTDPKGYPKGKLVGGGM